MPPFPLKVLHVASHAGVYRGGAVQLSRMAQAQHSKEWQVTVVCNMPTRISDQELQRHRESWSPLRRVGIQVLEIDLQRLGGLLRLRNLMRPGAFDIVHAHRDQALVACWLASWRLTRPALIAQRGTVNSPPKWPARAFRSPRTRAVVAVAEAVRQGLIASLGETLAPKTHVVYGSVDLDQFAPREPDRAILEQLALPSGARIIGSLSAWRRDKGFDTLLNAMAPVLTAHPDVYALFLGRGVDEKVRPLARELGIAEQVRFVGHQPDVARWLSVMELTVIAARKREGLSGVLRESLAMEIPVISTDCAGNTEIVRDGQTGLLTPVDDPAALERALRRALADPQAMNAMARAGRQWVRDHCSLEAQAAALEAVYRNALQPNNQ